MEDDWDLQAVVRGCSSSASAATTSTTTSTSTFSFFTNKTTNWSFSGQQSTTLQLPAIQGDYFMGFPDLFQPRRSDSNSIEELLSNFYRPSFFAKSKKLPLSPPQLPLPISPLSVIGGLQDLSPPPPPPQLQQHQQQQQQLYLQKPQLQPIKQGFGGSRSATTQNARSEKKYKIPTLLIF